MKSTVEKITEMFSNLKSRAGLKTLLFAVFVSAVFVFAVLPQLPNLSETPHFDLQAIVADACCGGGNDGGGGESNHSTPECGLQANTCKVGSVQNQGDTNTHFTWSCVVSGAVPASCSAPKPTSPPATPAPTCTFSASPTSVPHTGGNVSLTWTTTNATQTKINNGAWSLHTSHTMSNIRVDNNTEKSWTLFVEGPGGSTTCQASVTVQSAPTTPPSTPAPTCTLSASPTNLASGGGQTTLSWNTSNATSASINQGVGTVTPVASGSKTVNVSSSRTFVMTVNGPGGSATCSRTVTVDSTPPTTTPIPSCMLTSNPTSIEKGSSASLFWSTENAVSASINQGIGTVATGHNKSRTVSPNVTTVYTLTVKNSIGVSKTCSTTLTVTAPTATNQPPTASISGPVNACPSSSITLTGSASDPDGSIVKREWYFGQNCAGAVQGTGNTLTININAVPNVGQHSRSFKVTDNNGATACVGHTFNVLSASHASCSVPPSTPAPTCTLSASPTNLASGGGQTTLSWNTSNATSASINQGVGTVTPVASGSKTVNVSSSRTFVMTVNGPGGSATCSRTVTVDSTPPTPTAPTCTLDVSKTSLSAPGTVTLTWSTQNADNIEFIPAIGSTAKSGSRTVNVSETTTFRLIAEVSGPQTSPSTGPAICERTVTVAGTVPTPVCTLSASPTSIEKGQSSTLTWSTSHAVSASINQGIGTVATGSNKSKTISPNVTTTYTMTVKNSAGVSKTCTAKVTVTNVPTKPLPVCDSFSANRTSLPRGGGDITLSWNTSHATNVSINQGVGNVALDGSRVVRVNSSRTFTLTATNDQGSRTCSVAVSVSTGGGGGGGGGGGQPLRCDINANRTTINAGDEVRLSWTSGNARDVILRDNHGRTVFSTRDMLSSDKSSHLSSSLRVKPDRNTRYTLRVESGSSSRECSVNITVRGSSVTVVEARDQLPLTGISLIEVPYTGFEAGPMLTFLFYALLTIWALFLAYVFVIKRSGFTDWRLPALAGVLNGGRSAPTSEKATTTKEADQSNYSASATAAPTVSVPNNLPTASVASAVAAVGYASVSQAEETTEKKVMIDLEDAAHAKRVLLSSDAMRELITHTDVSNRLEVLEKVSSAARAAFPSEDGWVVLNLDRMRTMLTNHNLTDKETAATTPTAAVPAGSGSLAEAILEGNLPAAFALVADRPMVALADAAADLDAVYRARKGGTDAPISRLLAEGSARLTDDKLQAAIAALTGALDGTYNDEAEAVKMAVMKAIKAVA